MAALSPRQEAFCIEVVRLGQILPAYRAAGYSIGMSDKTASEHASRIMRMPKVIERIAELRAPAAAAAGMTLETHLRDLKDLRDRAATLNQFGAAISAEIARGKASGVHIEKSESMVTTKALPASVHEFV